LHTFQEDAVMYLPQHFRQDDPVQVRQDDAENQRAMVQWMRRLGYWQAP
jgi:hypothetical protein